MKTKIVSAVILIAILTTSLYVISNNVPVVGSFRFFWGPLVLALIFLTKPAVFLSKPMKVLLFYGFFILGFLQYSLWKQMSDWTRLALLNDFYSMLVFMAIFNYYIVRSDFKGFGLLGKLSFIFILITIILTNIALYLDPMVVRQAASSEGLSARQADIFKFTGSGGYGYMQALVCLIPIIIYHIRFRRQMVLSRNILILVLFIILVTLIRAQIFANILVAVLITTFAFSSAKTIRKSIIPLSIILGILLFLPNTFYSNLFAKASEYFDSGSDIYFKLGEFSSFIYNPEIESSTVVGARIARYPMLFEAFLSNPILGVSSYNSPFDIGGGGHLFWMNRLTQWGVLGFTLYIYVLYKIYKRIRSLFDESYGYYFFLSVLAFILLGLIKNIAGREPYLILIVVIPGLYYLPYIGKKEKLRVR